MTKTHKNGMGSIRKQNMTFTHNQNVYLILVWKKRIKSFLHAQN